ALGQMIGLTALPAGGALRTAEALSRWAIWERLRTRRPWTGVSSATRSASGARARMTAAMISGTDRHRPCQRISPFSSPCGVELAASPVYAGLAHVVDGGGSDGGRNGSARADRRRAPRARRTESEPRRPRRELSRRRRRGFRTRRARLARWASLPRLRPRSRLHRAPARARRPAAARRPVAVSRRGLPPQRALDPARFARLRSSVGRAPPGGGAGGRRDDA